MKTLLILTIVAVTDEDPTIESDTSIRIESVVSPDIAPGTVWQVCSSATVFDVNENPHGDESYNIEDGVTEKMGLQPHLGYELREHGQDSDPTYRSTIMTKYREYWNGLEVVGFHVTTEHTVGDVGKWTNFANGRLVKDIEKDLGSTSAEPRLSTKSAIKIALRAAKFIKNKQMHDLDSKNKRQMELKVYIDPSDNTAHLVYYCSCLILRDSSVIGVVKRQEDKKAHGTDPREQSSSGMATDPGKESSSGTATDPGKQSSSGTATDPGKQSSSGTATNPGSLPIDAQVDNEFSIPVRSKRAADRDEQAKSIISHIRVMIDANSGEVLHIVDQLMTQFIPGEMKGDGGNINVGMYRYGEWGWWGRLLKIEALGSICRMRNPHTYTASAASTFFWPPNMCFSTVFNSFINTPYQEFCNPSPSNDPTTTSVSQVHDAHYFSTRFQEMLALLFGDNTIPSCCGQVKVCVHYGNAFDNAFFYDQGFCETYYGDGGFLFTGLASADVVAHELGHAIIACTSGLQYWCQPGGMNEAFADISGIMFKAFLNGYDTNWMLGDTVRKNLGWGTALRFMDDPPRDGNSIDCTKDYNCQNSHYSSGIYNKGFYNLVQMEHWNIRTAYAVFLRATRVHWGATTGFDHGLCGLIQAAIDLGFRGDDLREAFEKVGVFCRCPIGWHTRQDNTDWHGNHRTACYKVVRDVASWAEARVYCKAMESDLVVLEDKSEIVWLYDLLTALGHKHHLLEMAEYWIGALDMSTENNWYWAPTDNPVSSANWAGTGEPNNYLGYQNCAVLRHTVAQFLQFTQAVNWKWYDDDCYQKKFFVCEKTCCGRNCRR